MAPSPHMVGPRWLEGRVAVLSPHLDDGVLSLGASIAAASRHGAEVRIVTVFAYDPETTAAAAEWDSACGFRSAAEAARVRRAEDALSCACVGATPVWLPFADQEYGDAPDDATLWAAIAEAIGDADVVLTPGFPLAIADHERVTRLVLERLPASTILGLYVEQPYASLRLMSRGGRAGAAGMSPRRGVANALVLALAPGRARRLHHPVLPEAVASLVSEPPHWSALPYPPRAWRAKRRAIRAHRSQVRGFGPLVFSRIALHERAWKGEGVAWLSARAR